MLKTYKFLTILNILKIKKEKTFLFKPFNENLNNQTINNKKTKDEICTYKQVILAITEIISIIKLVIFLFSHILNCALILFTLEDIFLMKSLL